MKYMIKFKRTCIVKCGEKVNILHMTKKRSRAKNNYEYNIQKKIRYKDVILININLKATTLECFFNYFLEILHT